MATQSSQPAVADPTFRSYSSTQARTYAAQRITYTKGLFSTIHELHSSTGGAFDQLLDVGCGPGTATRELAKYFDHVTGTDAGNAMIDTAREIGGQARSGSPIRFEVSGAEDCDKVPDLPPGSVDMISAAMAAHWFDMNYFWPAAAHVLKPGGSVVFWCNASFYCHPSTPNAVRVNEILHEFEFDILGPYMAPGNWMCRKLYRTLPTPWSIATPVEDFDQPASIMKVWNEDGKVEEGGEFFFGAQHLTFEQISAAIGTASMVTRWREAHPHLVGTEQDCVTVMINRVKEVVGPDVKGMACGNALVLWVIKKKKDTLLAA